MCALKLEGFWPGLTYSISVSVELTAALSSHAELGFWFLIIPSARLPYQPTELFICASGPLPHHQVLVWPPTPRAKHFRGIIFHLCGRTFRSAVETISGSVGYHWAYTCLLGRISLNLAWLYSTGKCFLWD